MAPAFWYGHLWRHRNIRSGRAAGRSPCARLARGTGGGRRHRNLHFEVVEWRRIEPAAGRRHYIVSDAAFIGRTFRINVAGAMLLVAYFAIKEREAASARFARAVELERARAQRITMAARLKVMQARVEPELLFGVLAEVRRIYERDLDAADALLDDLINYLRAALPQMRSEASTVDREIALSDAYLKLLPAARIGRLNVDVRHASGRERIPFSLRWCCCRWASRCSAPWATRCTTDRTGSCRTTGRSFCSFCRGI